MPKLTIYSPHHGARRAATVGIVIHSTRSGLSGLEQEYQRTINWFLNPASNVSAHRIVGQLEGQHCQAVEDDLTAWHAKTYNYAWLSIELAQPKPTDSYSDYQYLCCAAISKVWTRKYNIPLNRWHIRGHDEIPPGLRDGKSDPGPLWDWQRFMNLL